LWIDLVVTSMVQVDEEALHLLGVKEEALHLKIEVNERGFKHLFRHGNRPVHDIGGRSG
jgi:hypothetical protein